MEQRQISRAPPRPASISPSSPSFVAVYHGDLRGGDISHTLCIYSCTLPPVSDRDWTLPSRTPLIPPADRGYPRDGRAARERVGTELTRPPFPRPPHISHPEIADQDPCTTAATLPAHDIQIYGPRTGPRARGPVVVLFMPCVRQDAQQPGTERSARRAAPDSCAWGRGETSAVAASSISSKRDHQTRAPSRSEVICAPMLSSRLFLLQFTIRALIRQRASRRQRGRATATSTSSSLLRRWSMT